MPTLEKVAGPGATLLKKYHAKFLEMEMANQSQSSPDGDIKKVPVQTPPTPLLEAAALQEPNGSGPDEPVVEEKPPPPLDSKVGAIAVLKVGAIVITSSGTHKDKHDNQKAKLVKVLSSKVRVKFLEGPAAGQVKDFAKDKVRKKLPQQLVSCRWLAQELRASQQMMLRKLLPKLQRTRRSARPLRCLAPT